MQTYSKVRVYLDAFKTSALDASEWSTSRPGYFAPTERAHGYPLDRKLGGPWEKSLTIAEILRLFSRQLSQLPCEEFCRNLHKCIYFPCLRKLGVPDWGLFIRFGDFRCWPGHCCAVLQSMHRDDNPKSWRTSCMWAMSRGTAPSFAGFALAGPLIPLGCCLNRI